MHTFVKFVISFLSLALTLPVSTATLPTNQTQIVKPVTAKSLNGKSINPLEISPRVKLNSFVFIMHDCPISNQYLPEIKRIFKQFEAKGVRSRLVYEESGTAASTVKTHAKEYGTTDFAILDVEHTLAKRLGATITPEAIVCRPDGTVVYRGRINDLYVDYGKRRPSPTKNDLRDAISRSLTGKLPISPKTPAIGCYIPFDAVN